MGHHDHRLPQGGQVFLRHAGGDAQQAVLHVPHVRHPLPDQVVLGLVQYLDELLVHLVDGPLRGHEVVGDLVPDLLVHRHVKEDILVGSEYLRLVAVTGLLQPLPDSGQFLLGPLQQLLVPGHCRRGLVLRDLSLRHLRYIRLVQIRLAYRDPF